MYRKSTRREFLLQTALASATAGVAGIASGKTEPPSRKALANRTRRIIFNDDGDDVWHPDAATPEGFVAVRLNYMLNSQADTLFYCTTQSFNYFTHNTEVGEVFLNREGPFVNNNMKALLDQGTDPLQLAIEFAHANGIEFIWTLRMNDIHDAFTPQLWPQWKTDHPDALLGKREDWGANRPGSQARWWAGVNFNRADVRKRVLELIAEVAAKYDVDGIDLDWLRHPINFPETLRGETTSQAEVDLITGLMRDARHVVEDVGNKRGRPILLSTRVALTIAQGRYMGTDIATWLDEGLVDFITIGGGYVPFSMPTADIAMLCKKYGVPVYPCISASGMVRRSPFGKGQLYDIEGWRAAAANAFAQGASGVSLFNLFPSPGDEEHNAMVRRAFSELGSETTLSGKDLLYCLDNEAHMKTHGYINHIVPHTNCLPKLLTQGKGVSIKIFVAQIATPGSQQLRIQLDRECAPFIHLNGKEVTLARDLALETSIGLFWMSGPVSVSALREGVNKLEVQLREKASGDVRLTGSEILIRHG